MDIMTTSKDTLEQELVTSKIRFDTWSSTISQRFRNAGQPPSTVKKQLQDALQRLELTTHKGGLLASRTMHSGGLVLKELSPITPNHKQTIHCKKLKQ